MSIYPIEQWAHGALDALEAVQGLRQNHIHLVIRPAALATLIDPTAVGGVSPLRHFVAHISRANSVRFQRVGKKGAAQALAVYTADLCAFPALLGHALLASLERELTTIYMPITTRMHDILFSLVKVRAVVF